MRQNHHPTLDNISVIQSDDLDNTNALISAIHQKRTDASNTLFFL